MNVIKGSALVLAVVLTGALVTASSPESNSGATTAPAIRLKTISSRVTSKGTSLVIEATEPVPYVATRPDPLTLLLDFRNVAAGAVTSTVERRREERDRRGRRGEREADAARREPAHARDAVAAGRAPRPQRTATRSSSTSTRRRTSRTSKRQDPAVRAAARRRRAAAGPTP